MILCRYTTCERCAEIIENQRLYAANPIDFNDPFELLAGIIGEPDREEMSEYYRKNLRPRLSLQQQQMLPDGLTEEAWETIQETYKPALKEEIEKFHRNAGEALRVICFCDPEKIKSGGDDILLWSHYAKEHRGVRIFFETDHIQTLSTNLFPVVYSPERVHIDITNPNNDDIEEKYRAVIRTKNKSWQYEQEVRWIISKQECSNDSGKTYINILPTAIQRIDFGCRCDSENIALTALKENKAYKHVKLYKTSVHEHRFSLNYNEFNVL